MMSTQTSLWAAGRWSEDKSLDGSAHSSTAMSFSSSRPTSPAFKQSRFSSQPDGPLYGKRRTMSPDFLSPSRMRRISASKTGSEKGKEPVIGPDPNLAGYDEDPFAAHYNASVAFASYDNSRPKTSDSSVQKRARGSLLVAASDALNFKFRKTRKSVRQSQLPLPMILPGVIEISAPPVDEEVEERERLKGAAALSIGLGPDLLQDTISREESIEEEEEEEDVNIVEETVNIEESRTLESAINGVRSPHDSSLSVTIPTQPNIHRRRPVSLSHTRTNSAAPIPLPLFPSTPSLLQQFKQISSSLPKYYPPSSLRIFALTKTWKNRFIIFSSPASIPTRGSAPAVSHLHLFKTPGTDEKELERLEINEDSVVFVAEEEVGGRRHVIKVGGVDVGALKKDFNHEEGGRTMWLLQITDMSEAQSWIAAIKNAILGQRSMRAGLGLPAHTLGSNEPRGDMDVMLSMRAQGLITTPSPGKLNIAEFSSSRSLPNSPPPTISPVEPSTSSISSSSIRSLKSANNGPVSTLKGLFTGSTRPRSSSRATSIDSARGDREAKEESFASMGGNLLSMMRPNTADGGLSMIGSSMSTKARVNLPISGPVGGAAHRLDRKIVSDRHSDSHSIKTATSLAPSKEVAVQQPLAINTALSAAPALQPPPRKRWNSFRNSNTATLSQESVVYQHGDASVTGSFGMNGSAQSPVVAGFSFGTPEQKPRAPSIQSISTLASGENNVSLERSSSSIKRNSKRWSRQGSLPKRLTPPAGPPPAVPSSSRLQPHPYAGDQDLSRASSIRSSQSQKSTVSGLPTFSKRASVSSAYSVTTSSTSHSLTNGLPLPASRPTSSHRVSMPPPPRPAPTSALPPAPATSHDSSFVQPESPPPSKMSFRDSVTHRGFRSSLIAPRPPPSTAPPLRPDEPALRSQRRISSGSNTLRTSAELYTIPASPIPVVSPFPPPNRPLPTPPSAPSRGTSIKQRLRILSAPSPSGNTLSSSPSTNGAAHTAPRPRPSTMTFQPPMNAGYMYTPPATPIGEHIADPAIQNDPSFLQLLTPLAPPLPLPQYLRNVPEPDAYPELTSLSPAPRRGSKQLSVLEKEQDSVDSTEKPSEETKLLSLSRRGSVISLGIVNM